MWAAIRLALLSFVVAGCSLSSGEPMTTTLPPGFPETVPLAGDLEKVITANAGQWLWTVSVSDATLLAATERLEAAGFVVEVPIGTGSTGALLRGHDLVVALTAVGDSVTYVITPATDPGLSTAVPPTK